jgi:hypothetical protein
MANEKKSQVFVSSLGVVLQVELDHVQVMARRIYVGSM